METPLNFFFFRLKISTGKNIKIINLDNFPYVTFFYELALKKVSLLISHILVSCRDFGLLINLCLHKNESSSLVKGRILW